MTKRLLPALAGASLLVAAIVGIQQSFAGAGPASSGPPAPSSALVGGGNAPNDQPFVFENRRLATTSIAWGHRARGVPAGTYTFLNRPVSLNCPASANGSTCTFSAEMTAQFVADVSGDDWTVCFFVDGQEAFEPTCGWWETNAVAGEISSRTFTQNVAGVPLGPHMVQAFAYSAGGGRINAYNVNFRVYTP